MEALLAEGEIIEVEVEGWKGAHLALGSDERTLNELRAGSIPQAWKPLETTTTEEAVFLSPLDPVGARGRAKALFGFDYAWEVYKPEAQRKYGYYALPVLWGERLVARFDSKLERKANTLIVLGFWLEDEALGKDEAFAQALGRGLMAVRGFSGGGQGGGQRGSARRWLREYVHASVNRG